MPSRARAPVVILPFLVVAISLAIRVWLLLTRPLWHDELFTFRVATLPLTGLTRALAVDSGPPGFYLLEKPFAMAAAGMAGGDWILRLVSFTASLLLLAAAGTLPRGRSRVLLCVLVSGSLLLNLYAAEARPYALLGALCLALFLLTLRGEERPVRLGGVALVAASALYTHYLALFAVAALLMLAALSRRWRSCAALGVGLAAWLPWTPLLLAQPPAAVAWMRETPRASIPRFLSALGGVGRAPAPFGAAPHPALFYGGLAAGALLLALLAASRGPNRPVREATAFVLLVLTGTLIAGAWRPIAFAGRTELAALPVWLWGVALAAGQRRAVRWMGATAAALGLTASLGYVGPPQAEPAPVRVADALARIARPGDRIVAATAFYLPSLLASERGRLAAPVQALPRDLARHPGWFVPSLPGDDEIRVLADAARETPPGGRLFVVLPPEYATPEIRAALAAPGGRARELWHSTDVLVLLRTREARSLSPAAVP